METTNFHALKTLFSEVLLGSLLMVKFPLEPWRGLREKLWTKKVGRRIIIIRIIIIIIRIITRLDLVASNEEVFRPIGP